MGSIHVSFALALAGAAGEASPAVSTDAPDTGQPVASGDPIVHTMPTVPDDPEADPGPVDPLGPILVGSGIAATVAGVGLGSQALHLDQLCDIRCIARWSPQIGFATSAAVAATLGAAVTSWGVAKWIDARPPTPRTRTIAGVTLLSAAVASGATGAVLLGVMRARFQAADGTELGDLSNLQTMANAGIAVLAVVPSLLTTGLVTMLVHRRNTRGRVHARR